MKDSCLTEILTGGENEKEKVDRERETFKVMLEDFVLICASQFLIELLLLNRLLGPFIFTKVKLKRGPTIALVPNMAQAHAL